MLNKKNFKDVSVTLRSLESILYHRMLYSHRQSIVDAIISGKITGFTDYGKDMAKEYIQAERKDNLWSQLGDIISKQGFTYQELASKQYEQPVEIQGNKVTIEKDRINIGCQSLSFDEILTLKSLKDAPQCPAKIYLRGYEVETTFWGEYFNFNRMDCKDNQRLSFADFDILYDMVAQEIK